MSNETTPEAYFAQFGEIETVKRTRFQKIVAKTMVTNASTIPHVTHQDDADVTGLEAYRKTMEKKVSPLIFLIKAVVEALKAYPQFNASLTPDGETLVMKKFFHIGIAVDGPLGLLVPVLRDADQKDIHTLAAELKEVSLQARSKGLPMDKMQGGCFSISSLGGIGGTYFTPIINAPEVAILGAARARMQPVWDGSAFQPRLIMPVSLSWDHRVVDGAEAARFLQAYTALLADFRRIAL